MKKYGWKKQDRPWREIHDDICRYTRETASECGNRNFNFFISNADVPVAAVTYKVEDKSAFWGLDSAVDENQIFRWVAAPDSPFTNRKTLEAKVDELIANDQWHFQTDFRDAELLSRAMCKRVLLAFSVHFYAFYQCSAEILPILRSTWGETEASEFDCIDINADLRSFVHCADGLVRVNGRLHDGILEELGRHGVGYAIGNEKGRSVIILGTVGEGDYRPIAEIYQDSRIPMCYQCVSPTFYSGAMARVKKIRRQPNFGNASVFNFMFELESVSYATHLGLKDPRTGEVRAFFAESERELLYAYDGNEARLQDELIEKLERDADAVEAINDYLSQSGYTHGMNTSANIVTADDYLVFTKRGVKTFDGATLYCSANGVSEVLDEKVSYYHHTVDCDLPTIADAHPFGSFSGELTREAYAELGVFVEPTTWVYYGFCVMGYRSGSNHRFPLHFNILAHVRIDKDLKEVRHSSKTAVEKEENANVYGIGVSLAGSVGEAIIIKLRHLFQSLYSHKDVIADLLILYTIFTLFRDKVSSNSTMWKDILLAAKNLDLVDWVSSFVALLTVCFTAVEFRSILRESFRKHKRRYFYVQPAGKSSREIIRKCLAHAKKNARCKEANTLFVLMFQLYFYRNDFVKGKE